MTTPYHDITKGIPVECYNNVKLTMLGTVGVRAEVQRRILTHLEEADAIISAMHQAVSQHDPEGKHFPNLGIANDAIHCLLQNVMKLSAFTAGGFVVMDRDLSNQ